MRVWIIGFIYAALWLALALFLHWILFSEWLTELGFSSSIEMHNWLHIFGCAYFLAVIYQYTSGECLTHRETKYQVLFPVMAGVFFNLGMLYGRTGLFTMMLFPLALLILVVGNMLTSKNESTGIWWQSTLLPLIVLYFISEDFHIFSQAFQTFTVYSQEQVLNSFLLSGMSYFLSVFWGILPVFQLSNGLKYKMLPKAYFPSYSWLLILMIGWLTFSFLYQSGTLSSFNRWISGLIMAGLLFKQFRDLENASIEIDALYVMKHGVLLTALAIVFYKFHFLRSFITF
jgi:hypothetical protein